MVTAGFLGCKSGKGCYICTPGVKEREINHEAEDILKKYKIKSPKPSTVEEQHMRLVTRMVNEAILCLQEGILANPLEGDIGAVVWPRISSFPWRTILIC
ncbi:trifunctional enzyme subunit alpha, mitochondrial-like [Stegodyphus dumicola]|uniref:trifunctional enzyme subunit alpha, mitochondrial-like n=1 Tax=Stegodyphus dumicola TaxID=202533 RepID=UPI0015AD9DD9|nr:trifunctional enzyme subunit alpha, mitochondrial-like [Stegodyphus dumicola]